MWLGRSLIEKFRGIHGSCGRIFKHYLTPSHPPCGPTLFFDQTDNKIGPGIKNENFDSNQQKGQLMVYLAA